MMALPGLEGRRRLGSGRNPAYLRSWVNRAASIAALSGLLAGCAVAPSETVDLLVHNADGLALDEDRTRFTAMAVRGERIVAIGGEDLLERYSATETVDLDGRQLLPGFVDSHTHISGNAQRYLDLTQVSSIAEIQLLVTAKADELGPGEWITGYGWSEDSLAEGRRPLRADLDRAAPNNPVAITRAGAHSASANSLALAEVEWTRSSPDPAGGILERDESGELNGIVRERQDILFAEVPRASVEELESSLAENLADLFRHGITSIVQATGTVEGFSHWQRVYEGRRGALPRATVQLAWPGAEAMSAAGLWRGQGDLHLQAGPIKVFIDGGFTGPAAYTLEPYRGQPDYRGTLTAPEEELRETIQEAHRAGWQLGIHAIGDAAIVLAVDALDEALRAHPRDDPRHYLNHFTLPPPVETYETMASAGIHISQQPNFTYTLEGRYVEYLDGYRLEHNNPIATPRSHGIRVALSSDILPIGPFVGLYAATTRRGQSGRVFALEEAIDLETALHAYTAEGAYLAFWEDEIGTLEIGKLADFIVLDRDLFAATPEELLEARVVKTFLGGREVFASEAGEASEASEADR